MEAMQQIDELPPFHVKQDMELIDVLWRQDMDLGVAREAYDQSLRREFLKEEHLLENIPQKLSEFTNLDDYSKHEDEKTGLNQDDSLKYILDTETGEWEPAPVLQNEEPCAEMPNLEVSQLDDSDGLSEEEALHFLQQMHEDKQFVTPKDEVSAEWEPLPDENNTDTALEAMIHVAEMINTSIHTHQSKPRVAYHTQISFEQNWNEVVQMLDTDASNSEMEITQQNDVDMMNITDNNTSPLLNNATLVPLNNSFNFPDMQPVEQDMIGPGMPYNTSFNNDLLTNVSGNLFGLNSSELIFPNIALKQENGSNGNVTDFTMLPETGPSLLQQLIEPMESGYPVDKSLTEGINNAQISDDLASDSAVSSIGSSPLYQHDFNESASVMSNISSTFDGIEGAVGGSDYESGSDKFSPKMTRQRNSFSENGMSEYASSLRCDRAHRSRFISCTSNGSSAGDFDEFQGLDSTEMRHIKHNHSYTVPPGAAPKERKGDVKKREKQAQTGRKNLSRDEKKAMAMDIPFSTFDIIHKPVEEFNEMLQNDELSETQLQLIRDIRRRGKNKVAAQNCRKRKIETISTLEDEVIQLREQKDSLVRERRTIDRTINEVRKSMNDMYTEVFSSLRDDNGEPYDPTQYALELTSDGNVILIPTNSSVVARDHFEPSTRKRKGPHTKKSAK